MIFKTHRKNKSLVLPPHKPSEPLKHSQPLHSSPNSHSILQKAKQAYYHQSDFPTALSLFEQYLQFHPKCNEALYLSGVAYLHTNKSRDAIERLKLVSQEYHNHPNALLLASIATNKLGARREALELMDVCLRLYPEFEQALCFRGRLDFQMGCYAQAEMNFQKAVEKNPNSYLGIMGLADCLKATNHYSQAIKLYSQVEELLEEDNNKKEQKNPLWLEAQLKIAICLYYMEQFKNCRSKLAALVPYQEVRGSELYYYIGMCELQLKNVQKGVFNLQYAVRLQTNQSIVNKAYKKLIMHYFQSCQFYQALNVVKLGEQSEVKLKYWKMTVESFMEIIKGYYADGLNTLNEVLVKLKQKRESSTSKIKVKKSSKLDIKDMKDPIKIELPQTKKKSVFFQSPKSVQKTKGFRRYRNNSFQHSVAKAIAKIGSVRNYKSVFRASHDVIRHKTQHFASTLQKVQKVKHLDPIPKVQSIFSTKQKQVVYPLLLKFKAYAQFFQGNFMTCSQTYEEYEAYIKDMFGQQSQLVYNRLLCQAMMLSHEDMADEALIKLGQCVQCYFDRHRRVPVEAVLYKLCLLLRLAAYKATVEQSAETDREESEMASSEQILSSILNMFSNYRTVIYDHHLAHFFNSVVYILQNQYQNARECLEKGLKIVQECTWKYLYVKGTIQMNLDNYYDAIKEYSAGLILEIRPEFYLGRSVAFCILAQQNRSQMSQGQFDSLMKSIKISADLTKQKGARSQNIHPSKNLTQRQIMLEHCLDDLERYIEMSQDKEEMGKWVSRLLFATGSYEEALGSLAKMDINSSEMVQITECIQIYQGQFQHGGQVGLVLKSAFDGVFLSKSEQSNLLQTTQLRNYLINPVMDYLDASYQKWLVILSLYTTEKYPLLIKYMQRQLFSVKQEKQELLLRYNLFVVYLLVQEQSKAVKVVKSMEKFQGRYGVDGLIGKMEGEIFESDQCVVEMGKAVGAKGNRLLSHFLPYKQTTILKDNQQINIFVRINIPFPTFPLPNFQIKIDSQFVLSQIGLDMIQKKIQAPWIRKTNNNMFQFTDTIQDSHLDSQLSSMHYPSVSNSSRSHAQNA